MKTSILLPVLVLTVTSTAVLPAQTSSEHANYFGTAAPATDLPQPASSVAPQATSGQTFEQRITGSIWDFPWDGKTRFIELKPKGNLVLGWNKGAKGFKWRIPEDGVVEVYVYMDGRSFDTMRVPSDGHTAALTRGGKQIAIIKRRY